MGYCYAIDLGDELKFGWSENPWVRLQTLKNAGAKDAQMIGYVLGSRVQEARLHELLRNYRTSGERYRKCIVTEVVSCLFPRKRKISALRSRATLRHESHTAEAKSILQSALLGGEARTSFFNRISDEIGITPRKVKALWYEESCAISSGEMQSLRALAERIRGASPEVTP